jgi:NADP-dependent 3-hydroxy acid dehydrogenase YdfG
MGNLDNKLAWVTGAVPAWGCRARSSSPTAGATVVMSGRRGDVLEREAAAIRSGWRQGRGGRARRGDAAAVQRAAAAILRVTAKVDILVNSAGLNNPQRAWRDQTVAGWDEVISHQSRREFYCIRAVLPSMRERKTGSSSTSRRGPAGTRWRWRARPTTAASTPSSR